MLVIVFYAKHAGEIADPDDQRVVYLDELPAVTALSAQGAFVVNLYRESGKPFDEGATYQTRDAALAAALASFRRAQIEAVAVRLNTPNRLDVSSAFLDHHGRAGGKNLGAFEIVRTAA
ncbi:hypothetical protein [Brevundimonas sp. Marseille-Q4549]